MPFQSSDIFSCRPVPQLDGAIRCPGSEHRPIRRKYHRSDKTRRGYQEFTGCRHIVQPHANATCHSEALTIRRKRNVTKAAFAQACDCAVGQGKSPSMLLGVSGVPTPTALNVANVTQTERYPNDVCSRKGTKGKDRLCPAIGIGRCMLSRGLSTQLSITGGDYKGDSNIW